MIEGVKAKAAEIQQMLPSDVKLEAIRDQSDYIYAALHEINIHLVLGLVPSVHGGVRFHQKLAIHHHRRCGDSGIGHHHLRDDVCPAFHTQ